MQEKHVQIGFFFNLNNGSNSNELMVLEENKAYLAYFTCRSC